MGETGEYSSVMPNNSQYQQNFLVNNYTVSDGFAYTIYVPLAVWTPLASNDTDRENLIRSFADKYNLAGMIYDVQSI
jgi:hypothetical protein